MVSKTISDYYNLSSLLSKNSIAESWEAGNLITGKNCFLKISNLSSDLNQEILLHVLNNSFRLQKLIKSTRVLTARGRKKIGNKLVIEYPFLEGDSWKALHRNLFWEFYPSSLIQICQIVDYLHLLGLVHCDLSLANFQLRQRNDGPEIILTDLDFLIANRSSARAMLFGTPQHVAPEIMRNEIVTTQADNYSIGVLLKLCAERGGKAADLPGDHNSSADLKALINNLMSENPHIRSINLTDGLYHYGVIDENAYRTSKLRLFGMFLTTQLLLNRQYLKSKRSRPEKFFEDNKIYGLSPELLADFGNCFRLHSGQTLAIFRELIRGAKIDRYVDYWQIDCSDDQIERSYVRLGRLDDRLNLSSEDVSDHSLPEILNRGNAQSKAGHRLKSFLGFKKVLQEIDNQDIAISPSNLLSLLDQMVSLADGLQRTNESLNLQKRLLALHPKGSDKYFEILKDLVTRYFYRRELGLSEKLIDEGKEAACRAKKQEWIFEFSRLEAWQLAADAKYDEAGKILKGILKDSQADPFFPMVIKCYSSLGTIYWRNGDFKQARDYYELSYKTASEHKSYTYAISAMGNLSMYYFEISEYKKALKYVRKVFEHADKPLHSLMYPQLYFISSQCYARLGRYDRAQNLMQDYLQCTNLSNQASFYHEYYACLGWLELQRGSLEQAESYLYKALGVPDVHVVKKTRGKVYQNLAELYLYKGHYRRGLEKLEKARKIFSQTRDKASLAEINFIDKLYHYCTAKIPELDELNRQYSYLAENNCNYYCALCLVHILSVDHKAYRSINPAAAVKNLIKKSSAPIFRLLNLLDSATSADAAEALIGAYKDAYKILESAGYVWLSAIICRRIGQLYGLQNQARVARKYADQSISILRGLGNESLEERFSKMVEKSPEAKVTMEDRLGSFLQVSEILKNISDYGNALEQVVKLAIDETGAERGALLLYSQDRDELQIKSYIDCDQQSLADITALSRNIPKLTLEKIAPLLIDNAQADPRTKNFKSVYAHNIRSVICIPIVGKDKIHGILYLDHHTIPALFNDTDLTFAYSLGNFLALIIETLQRYKFSEISAQQTYKDLIHLGAGDLFVTRDNAMQEMLSKLPELAKTNASILILGESGTGKEIICRMIHKHSLRADQPLIKLNCAAIPVTLIESELFGIARGVASGVEERKGKFEIADQGTLFLDEIGDMPVEIQAKVLRVLEYQEFERVGSHRTVYSDIRFIYATNRDLTEMIKKKEFRQDLFHRINTITIEITPLRDRPEDIVPLTEHFMGIYAADKKSYPLIPSRVFEYLMAYHWPGNVRELRNIIERLCMTRPGKAITVEDLPAGITDIQLKNIDRKKATIIEKARLQEALIKYQWNYSRAARSLNIPLSTFRRRSKKYGIIDKK